MSNAYGFTFDCAKLAVVGVFLPTTHMALEITPHCLRDGLEEVGLAQTREGAHGTSGRKQWVLFFIPGAHGLTVKRFGVLNELVGFSQTA